MSLQYDPKSDLRHWPTPMAKYGQNPYGENLYRIVLRDSRRHLVGGTWPDGSTGYEWVPKYRKVSSPWVLERWYTSWEFTKMSRSMWDLTMKDPQSGWLLLGPYPDRGEYDLVWEFDHGVDSDNLDQIIAACERARSRSFEDVRAAHKAEYEQEERDQKREAQAEIRDAMMAFGTRPMVSSRLARGFKTAPLMRSAEELGLRTPRPMTQSKRPISNRKTFDLREMPARNTLMAGGR